MSGKKEDKKEDKKETGLETRFVRIEEILKQMEDENVTLDESFELYKKGLNEISAANQSLEKIEKEMLVLREDGKLEEF